MNHKSFRYLILCIVSIFLPAANYLFGQTTIQGGEVYGTWNKSSSPYIINGDVTIPGNEKLVIEPGVELHFTGRYSLTVSGCLRAVGTQRDSIVFTALDTAGYHKREHTGWKGIRFHDVVHADSSRLEFVVIEYGKATGQGDAGGGGAIFSRSFGKLALRNSTLRENESRYGGAIALVDVNQINFTALNIKNNYSADYGGAVYSDHSNSSFTACFLTNNQSGEGGGIFLRESNAGIYKSIIVNNRSSSGGAITAQWLNKIIIENSTLAGNLGGPDGIDLYRSDLYCKNTILWNKSSNNTFPEVYGVDYSSINLNHCIVKGTYDEEWNVFNCLNQNPGFVDLANSNVNLLWSNFPVKDESKSVAIDGGDPQSEHDPDGTIADIGGLPFNQSSAAFPTSRFRADTTQGVVPFTVSFIDYSTQANGKVEEWLWDFGDGFTSTEQSPHHIYEESGVYDVKLVITNQDGKKDSLNKAGYIKALNGTVINSGEVSGTWTKEGSPFNIYNDIEVPDGEVLKIEPGVKVVFFGGYRLTVQGSLQAKGTVNDSIIFTRFNAESNWNGIRLEGIKAENDSSIFAYCKIEYAHYLGGDVTKNGGNALFVKGFNKVRVSNSLLQNNHGGRGAGIYCDQANIIIRNNLIKNNSTAQYGAGIHVVDCSPLIYGNTIDSNYAGDNGGGIHFSNSQSIVKNNFIKNNSCYWTGAGLAISSSDVELVGNIISNNESDHDDGGGVAIYSCSPKIINNTICFNVAEDGEGVYISGESKPDFINTIVFSNRGRYSSYNRENEIYLASAYSQPNFYNCDIQGGIEGLNLYQGTYSGIAENIIDLPPLFSDTLKNDYTLKWNNYPVLDKSKSPCIDAGKQDTAHDPDGTIADIGALYFHQENANVPPRADFKADTLLGFNELTVNFTDLSDKGSGEITSWSWNFGDGATSSEQYPVHQYSSPGVFDVTLTIIDERGFEETLSREKYITIHKGTYLPGGDVEGTFSDKQYLVGGDLVVPVGKKLSIEEGVKFVFFGNYQLKVQGSLQASGSQNNMVIFTYFDTLGMHLGHNEYSGNPTGWGGISIESSNANDSTILDFCKVEFVGNFQNGAIDVSAYLAKTRISNSEICYNSTQGILTNVDDLVIRQNYIHHNYTSMYGKGAGIYVSSGEPTIVNNLICSNSALSDGGGIAIYSGRPDIINNAICHNSAIRGGGISNYEGWIDIINNTIYKNTAQDGGGYFTIYAGDVTFTNSVIAGNYPNQVLVNDVYTRTGFSHCILEGGKEGMGYYNENVFLYENVLINDPQLSSAVHAHGRLLKTSPAIDAGTLSSGELAIPEKDLLGNPRVKNNKVDIGAYEYEDSEAVMLLSKVGAIKKEEEFEEFYIGLDSIFYNPLGKRFVGYEIPNQEAIELVEVRIQDHHLEVTSIKDKFGEVVISLYSSDGVNSGVYDTLYLEIKPVNDPPIFAFIENILLDEDFANTKEVNLLPYPVPFGEESQVLSYAIAPESLNFVNLELDSTAGKLHISPKENAFGTKEIEVKVYDGQEDWNSYAQKFTLTVSSVNDAPVIETIEELEVTAGERSNFRVMVTDVEKDEINFSVTTDDPFISLTDSLTISEDQEYEYTVELNSEKEAEGLRDLVVAASDGESISYSAIYLKIINDYLTSVGEMEDIQKDELYPNPVVDQLHVKTQNEATATLYNLKGEPIKEINLEEGNTVVEMGNLTPGIYFLRINQKERYKFFRIIKI